MADQAGVPQITNTGQAPPGFTFVHQSDPGAIASDFGGHTFYIAPTNAAATAGAGSQNQSQAGGGLRNYQTVGVDPNQPLTNLGAAALQQNAVYNPQPGAGTGGDTGVTGSGGSGFAGGGGLTIGGISTQQPRITTSGVVPKAPTGPWSNVPSLFNKAPMPTPTAPLAVTPTPQATGMAYQPGQSWATPPPAPGITFGGGSEPMPMGGGGQQGVPQNWQGAGQVPPTGRPSGGGVPGSAIALGTTGAQPAPYTGTVHNDPFMSNAVSKLMGLASNPWHPEGSTTASPASPIKMQSGGWVPGDPNDNTDSVSAQLSPGEYVIPKGQASGFNPQEQAYLQGQIAAVTPGGEVNPALSASTSPMIRRPEIPRGLLGGGITPATQSKYYSSPPPAPSNQQSRQQSNQSRAASTHTDDRAGTATIGNLGKLYAGQGAGAIYDAQGNVVTSSPGLSAQAAAGAGSTMDASGAIRDPSGNIYDSSANLAAQDVGGAGATMPGGGAASGATTGGGMGGMGSAIGGAIGSIGSALQSALANVPSWKMQASHIPDPSSFKKQQTQYNLQTPSA